MWINVIINSEMNFIKGIVCNYEKNSSKGRGTGAAEEN